MTDLSPERVAELEFHVQSGIFPEDEATLAALLASERTDACVTSDSGLPETGSESCRSCAGTGIVWPSPVPVPTTKGSE